MILRSGRLLDSVRLSLLSDDVFSTMFDPQNGSKIRPKIDQKRRSNFVPHFVMIWNDFWPKNNEYIMIKSSKFIGFCRLF